MKSTLAKSNLELALEHGSGIVPDIEKIVGFRFVDGEIIESKIIENTQSSSLISDMSYHESKGSIKKIYKQINAHHWYLKSDIPFELERSDFVPRQMKIEDPLADSVLTQKIILQNEDLLLFVYFRANGAYFGHYKGDVANDTQYKQIIALSYTYSIKQILKSHFDLQNQMLLISESIKGIFEAQKEQQKTAASNILELAYSYISEIKDNKEREIAFSPDAIQKLSTYNGSLVSLKQILNAAYLASDMVYGTFNSNQKLIIEAAFINVNSSLSHNTDLQEQIVPKNNNIISFLNRLEDAGRDAKSKDLKITGKHLGLCTQPKSVSAAAISEYIQKNKTKIVSEMNSQPHRWNIIRKEFSPILRIIAS
ncbi:MAG: hypothetical protein JEZ03_07725 [Bacteroidales bacterium]|nr:hypothetical protein [Bacteroidales bacterium]